MKILLFDSNNTLVKTLKNVDFAKHPEELNGENILEIETYDEVEKGQYLVYKDHEGYWHEFLIKEVDEERAVGEPLKRVFAESSFYETLGDFIEDKRPSGTADHALTVALEPTRWQVGLVDNFGTNHTSFYRTSSKEAVSKVVETWGGELRTRIEISDSKVVGRYVDLLNNRGHDLGKRFTYTKDLTSIRKTVQREDVITALYGFGKGEELETGGYGRRINFSEINGGKMYLENNDARLIWGRGPEKAHVFGKVEFDDCEDIEELKELTEEELEFRSQPQITYEAKVVDLKAMGVAHEGVGLGDYVRVIDKEFKPELRLRAKVIKLVRDLLEPENTEITLGNFLLGLVDRTLEQEDYINNFRDKQGVWDRSGMFDRDGLDSSYINGVIDVVKNKLESTQSKWWTDDNGNFIFEATNGTSAMLLGGAGYMIADTKLPNGEWNWRTLGTGSGIVADVITAGILSGGKVRWNLEDGTLLIGESTEDFFLKWTGTELYIKGDKIDLSGNEELLARVTKTEIMTDPEIQEALKGTDGKDGQSMVRSTPEYYLSTSSTAQSGGTWSSEMPTYVKGKYIWIRFKNDFVNPTETKYTTPVLDKINNALNDIYNTGVVLPTSKPALLIRLSEIAEEYEILSDEEGPGPGSSKYAAYETATQSLITYLGTITADMDATSEIDPEELASKTEAYDKALMALRDDLDRAERLALSQVTSRVTSAEQKITDEAITDVITRSESFVTPSQMSSVTGEIVDSVQGVKDEFAEFKRDVEGFTFEIGERLEEDGKVIADVKAHLTFTTDAEGRGVLSLGDNLDAMYLKQTKDRISFMDGSLELAYFAERALNVYEIIVEKITMIRYGMENLEATPGIWELVYYPGGN